MVDRIASFAQTSKLISNNLSIQAKYAEGQIQLSSGIKSTDYQGIAKDANRLLNLESEQQRLTTQTENAQTALDRTEVSFDSFGSLIALGQSFASDLTSAINGNTQANQIQAIAQGALEQSASTLNTVVAGRYIFGGSATKTPPVDINDPAFGGNTPPSAADTNYYQGNNYIQSVEVSENFELDYGVTANDPAIEQMIRAFDLVRTSPNDQNALNEALGLVQDGLDNLAVSKAQISQSSQALDRRINENQEQLTLLDEMVSNVKDVDLAEVSVRLQEYEAQLEASYAVTTNLLNLNISDFI